MTEGGEGISTISCVCVCVNMMIGAGFLALPYGFQHGGIVASIGE
jgi:amino acid permease